MDFHDKWIRWVKLCLQIVHFPVIINGDPVGKISLGRRLRQGDLLSPYMFIICSEAILAIVKNRGERLLSWY